MTGKWSNGNYTLTFGPIFLMRLFMSFYLPAPVGTKRGDQSEREAVEICPHFTLNFSSKVINFYRWLLAAPPHFCPATTLRDSFSRFRTEAVLQPSGHPAAGFLPRNRTETLCWYRLPFYRTLTCCDGTGCVLAR